LQCRNQQRLLPGNQGGGTLTIKGSGTIDRHCPVPSNVQFYQIIDRTWRGVRPLRFVASIHVLTDISDLVFDSALQLCLKKYSNSDYLSCDNVADAAYNGDAVVSFTRVDAIFKSNFMLLTPICGFASNPYYFRNCVFKNKSRHLHAWRWSGGAFVCKIQRSPSPNVPIPRNQAPGGGGACICSAHERRQFDIFRLPVRE